MLQTNGPQFGPSSPDSSFDDETPIELDAEPVSEKSPQPMQGELFLQHCYSSLLFTYYFYLLFSYFFFKLHIYILFIHTNLLFLL